MKITAILEDFNRSPEQNTRLVQAIREQSGAEFLVTAMMGDFTEDSFPMSRDKYVRAREAEAAGVDMVLEIPVIAGLSDKSTKIFSGIALLKRLYSVDQVAVLCHDVDGARLSELGRFLFMAPPAYQAELKKLMKAMPASGQQIFDAAQAQAAEKFVPGAEEILMDPVNRTAVEIIKSMYQFYWVIKPAFIDIGQLELEEITEKAAPRQERNEEQEQHTALDKALAEEIHRMLLAFPTGRELEERLADTPDGTPEICDRILAGLEWLQTESSFTGMTERLAGDDLEVGYVRGFLMKFLLGMERGNIIICGLRANCPHGRVLALRDPESPAYERIQGKTWVPLLMEREQERQVPGTDRGQNLDEVGRMLAVLDDRAHDLYTTIQGK